MKVLLNKKHRFPIICVLIILSAIVSRFVFLGDKPLHHDEGMLSYFAWRLSHFKDYTYTPQIHSPILFYVEAVLYLVFGVSDKISKVGPALFGVALVSIPLFFHKLLSKRIAIFVSLGFLISPIFLYYSRFLVHTSMAVVFWLLFILTLYQYVKKQTATTLYLSFMFLSLAFGTSETSYILMAIFGLFVVASFMVFPRKAKPYCKNLWGIFIKNYLDFITGALIFILVWAALYSVGFTNPESLHRSLPLVKDESTGLGFWLAQHPKKLGGQPWHYYLMLGLLYETFFVFGTLGFIFKFIFNRRSAFKLFIIIWSIGSLGVYSWAGEKFPWLFLPSLLPMIVATGYYLGENFTKFNIYLKIFWLILALWTAFVAIRLVYISPADTRELAVYVQTPVNFQKKIDQITSDCKNTNDNNCVLIDQKISWPLSWSFRNFSTLIVTDNYAVQPTTKYLIVGNESAAKMKEPENMKKETMWLRDWWVPNKCRKVSCIGKFLRYYFLRQTWNGKGGYDVYVYSR